jgi:hypothetical protein
MTEMHSQQARPARSEVTSEPPEPTGWVGWILFAGVMLVLAGSFQAIAGFVALFNDSYFAVPSHDLVINVDYTAWGWAHLSLGVLCVFAGFGVMAGQMWARVATIVIASVAAIVNISFINSSPVWFTILIALDVLVIWAVAVHGDEAKEYGTSG